MEERRSRGLALSGWRGVCSVAGMGCVVSVVSVLGVVALWTNVTRALRLLGARLQQCEAREGNAVVQGRDAAMPERQMFAW